MTAVTHLLLIRQSYNTPFLILVSPSFYSSALFFLSFVALSSAFFLPNKALKHFCDRQNLIIFFYYFSTRPVLLSRDYYDFSLRFFFINNPQDNNNNNKFAKHTHYSDVNTDVFVKHFSRLYKRPF